ncbi:AAA family ATPase [Aminobacter carboxidus]|uniref:AAA family ATPase n=1 Tax=Aminobacter carboxidus TaxID=376165 RepID=A0ABR9GJB8_9HYPH|nr:AAA family ATPase [Aminobacter carboxidus]MBE1203696.1 AAA family ATPase [Aminobacter carboxidus]
MSVKDPAHLRHFKRREKAAVAGLHLPTEDELLRGMSFFRDSVSEDIREYAIRLSGALKTRCDLGLAGLIAALDRLTVDQNEHTVQDLMTAFGALESRSHASFESGGVRCQFYLAVWGHPDAAARIAGDIATLALNDLHRSDDLELLWRSLAWSAFSSSIRSQGYGLSTWHRSGQLREKNSFEYQFQTAILKRQASPRPEAFELTVDELEKAGTGEPEKAQSSSGSVVVFRSAGNETTPDGRKVEKEFREFFGKPLPLPAAPDLALVRTRLVAEFPYAVSAIDTILRKVTGKRHAWLRPTILLGPPGGGKSRFAWRLMEELGLPYEMVPCGGISDSAIGGTARRWSTGEPSMAVMAIRRHKCAGPAIILDELEKVATSRHNGNVHDVLVGLLEKETSTRWFDPYLEASCNLSHVSWLMTANEVRSVPAVLLDRCRILQFPLPGPDQLMFLAPRILEHLYVELGHDPRWATPLDQVETDALASVWPGGSIRKLHRLVEKLVEVREDLRGRQ